MSRRVETEVVVLGSGPGGYSAAFRAADLGKQVVLIERYQKIGGVCLNVGCIPSKALLHLAKVIDDAHALSAMGVAWGVPKFDLNKIRAWKNSVVNQLTSGLSFMAKQRQVKVVTGHGRFISTNEIKVDEKTTVSFEQCIIATGSLPLKLPFIPDDPRVMDSTRALELTSVDGELLILGGGIIGLEMATVYSALGAKVSIVEKMDQLMTGADTDIVLPLQKRIAKRYEHIMLKTSVTKVTPKKDGLWVTFDGDNVPSENPKRYDHLLVAVGRSPSTSLIDTDKAGIAVNNRGFITVDHQMKTNVDHIYAIGDVVGNPMLAHKASTEGRLAAEVIAGKRYFFDAKCIPAVAYTDPEVAWVGVTETEAKARELSYKKALFPWVASGRALSMSRSEGVTKLLFDEKGIVIGGAIVGVNAGDLISEIALAIEMGCDAQDISLTIHPHPTLSESIMMAAEVYEGTVTDLYIPREKS